MASRAGWWILTIVSLIVVLAAAGLLIADLVKRSQTPVSSTSASSTSTANPVTPVGGAARPAPGGVPRGGAASLNIDQCGCPTSGPLPVCNIQRSWNLSKVYNPAEESFDVVVKASDARILSGQFILRIANTGDSITRLTSVYVALELQQSQAGNAIGPSGSNFQIVSEALISAASECGNTAALCNRTVGVSRTASPGSSLQVEDVFGNSIAVIDVVSIPPTLDNDNDGVRDEDSPDGLGCGGIVDADDDGDGLKDEDGVCSDTVSFVVKYSFTLSDVQFAAIKNRQVRINRLATFIANGLRGGTCQADTDCSGGISPMERTVRTVQSRQGFTVPGICPLQCDCATVSDEHGFVTLPPGATDAAPVFTLGASNFTMDHPICLNGTYVHSTGVAFECPFENPTEFTARVFDEVTLTFEDPICEALYGASTEAIASFYCEQTVFPSPIESPVPTPESPVGPHPPNAGDLCTYTLGIYKSDNQLCSSTNTSICTDRRGTNPDSNKPACIRKLCLDAACPNCRFYLTANQTASAIYNVVDLNAMGQPNGTFDALVVKFIADNAPPPPGPGYFIETQSFDQSFLLSTTATSGRQFARQLLTALINRLLTEQTDTVQQKAIFNSLVFQANENCSTVLPPWANSSVTLNETISFAHYFIGELQTAYATAAAFVTQCRQHCSNHPLCSIVGPYYSVPGFISTTSGRSLSSELTSILDLYNKEFDNCMAPETGCLVIPAIV